ncbi:MAG: GspH/FimT family pseudopilin [Gemmatimonadota bacterium]
MIRNVKKNGVRDSRGFTVVELTIALSSMAVLTAITLGSFRQYSEAMSARKAAVQFAADVGLTRSFAIQRRENVSLVVNEDARTYVVRDTSGTVLMRRDFSGTAEAELALTQLTLNTSGDSLTFNSRGLLSSGTAEATLIRRDRSHHVTVNGLGRTTLN